MRTQILFAFLSLSSLANSKSLSNDSLLSFDCTLSSGAGRTKLVYNKSEGPLAQGRRNGFVPVQYNVSKFGNVTMGSMSSSVKSQISLSGGALQKNQYLTLLFNNQILSGTSSASGTIFLVTMGGSVFAPVMSQNIPVGLVTCSSIEVK